MPGWLLPPLKHLGMLHSSHRDAGKRSALRDSLLAPPKPAAPSTQTALAVSSPEGPSQPGLGLLVPEHPPPNKNRLVQVKALKLNSPGSALNGKKTAACCAVGAPQGRQALGEVGPTPH